MRIISIIMILTLSSCVVSTKVFDETILDLQNQIDSKVPRYEFETKDQILRGTIDECCKVKNDTIVPHDPAND